MHQCIRAHSDESLSAASLGDGRHANNGRWVQCSHWQLHVTGVTWHLSAHQQVMMVPDAVMAWKRIEIPVS
jgi:hypothetical protein